VTVPDKALASLSDAHALELGPDEPLDVLAGEPTASTRELYHDQDAIAGIWEVTPGTFAWHNDGYVEHMHILSGDGTATSDDGTRLELRPGVSLTTTNGWRGQWDVRQTIRKFFVVNPLRMDAVG
jgi:uncharacterized cupin superfamily protein